MLTQAWLYELLLGVNSTLSATRGNPITVLRWDAEPLRDGEFDTAFKAIVCSVGTQCNCQKALCPTERMLLGRVSLPKDLQPAKTSVLAGRLAA